MQTVSRPNSFVSDFSLMFVFTIYEQILSHGIERRTMLATILFDENCEVIKILKGLKNEL